MFSNKYCQLLATLTQVANDQDKLDDSHQNLTLKLLLKLMTRRQLVALHQFCVTFSNDAHLLQVQYRFHNCLSWEPGCLRHQHEGTAMSCNLQIHRKWCHPEATFADFVATHLVGSRTGLSPLGLVSHPFCYELHFTASRVRLHFPGTSLVVCIQVFYRCHIGLNSRFETQVTAAPEHNANLCFGFHVGSHRFQRCCLPRHCNNCKWLRLTWWSWKATGFRFWVTISHHLTFCTAIKGMARCHTQGKLTGLQKEQY